MMKSHSLNTKYQAVTESPIPHVACLGIRMDNGQLKGVDFLTQLRSCRPERGAEPVVKALQTYLLMHRDSPALAVTPDGTPFQQRVWLALRKIPFGDICSYGELATELGSSARAVAGACRANPVPLLIPCHRVVAATGPGGYMGQTSGNALAIKRWLLQHEGHV